MANDTPFDPDLLPRIMVGEPTPTMPFTPARDPKEPFSVKDETTANWVVRKIVEARAYADRVREYADLEMKRAARQEQFFLDHYGPALEEWARQRLAEQGGRLKRVRLPAGAVGYRRTLPRLTIEDEEILLEWCRNHLPGAIVRTERVIKPLITDHVGKTGECPEGANVVPAGDRFFVR